MRDAEEEGVVYRFRLRDSHHCACFHLGAASPGGGGSPQDEDAIISWSELHALYRLPDGSTWAEHGYYHDADDVSMQDCENTLSYWEASVATAAAAWRSMD